MHRVAMNVAGSEPLAAWRQNVSNADIPTVFRTPHQRVICKIDPWQNRHCDASIAMDLAGRGCSEPLGGSTRLA